MSEYLIFCNDEWIGPKVRIFRAPGQIPAPDADRAVASGEVA